MRAVQQRLRQEQRALDREVRQIDLAVNKVKGDVRRLAKKGDVRNAKLLSREVVRANKHQSRLITSKAHLNSISMQLQQQLGALQAYQPCIKSLGAFKSLRKS